MIKTALTVNISQKDIARYTYLVNKTHLGLLSSASQTIYIQTSHRPIQYIVGLEASEADMSSDLKLLQKRLNHWQSFLPILIQNGIKSLNDLLVKYQSSPDLMICFDQNVLQAWLPKKTGLYLLRDGQLLRMKSIAFEKPLFSVEYHEQHDYYAVQIAESDFFLMLPPELPTFFQSGEIADLLLGLRQLPAKMSELIRIARLRGFEAESTWFAIEVQRKEEDQRPPADASEHAGERRKYWMKKSDSSEKSWIVSASESLSEPDEEETGKPLTLFGQLMANKPFRNKTIIAAILVFALVLALVIGQSINRDPTTTSLPTQTTVKPTESVSPTAAPTRIPTVTPVPTEPPVQLVVSAQRLNFRDAPGLDGTLLRTLTNGDILIQLAEPVDDWVHVETEDGVKGYVYADYVQEYTKP